MKIYKVGGCVRDYLLGIEADDIDYVVVGSTPEEMLKMGFSQVGKKFPVFLHPKTGEEYALARVNTKIGNGYQDSSFDFLPSVTLEEDLGRRDLTINAIAQDHENNIYDPFDGKTDLKNKILRHINEHFKNDPLRAIRLARFKAKFYDFSIDLETVKLLQEINDSNELLNIPQQRFRDETIKAFKQDHYLYYLKTLQLIGSTSWNTLNLLFPIFDLDRTKPIKFNKSIVNEIHNNTKYNNLEEKITYLILKSHENKEVNILELLNNLQNYKFNNNIIRFVKISINIDLFIKKQLLNNKTLTKPSLDWFDVFSKFGYNQRPEEFIKCYKLIYQYYTDHKQNEKIPNLNLIKMWHDDTILNVHEFLIKNSLDPKDKNTAIYILLEKNKIYKEYVEKYKHKKVHKF